jgi:hypothetical protein
MENKKSKNPFIAAVQAAQEKKAAELHEKIHGGAPHSQKEKLHVHNQVSTNKPTKRSAGRGR